jgi:DNA-binding CsgD family transcriptional regulator
MKKLDRGVGIGRQMKVTTSSVPRMRKSIVRPLPIVARRYRCVTGGLPGCRTLPCNSHKGDFMKKRSTEPGLTLTEAGVARLVAEGRTNTEVAALLAIRPTAVQDHLACVCRKLGVGSRTELVLLLATSAVHEGGEQ